jgi:hypothetical protein
VAKLKDSKLKCWFYDPRKQINQDSITSYTIAHLSDFNIDPLTVVIGFFSVVGGKAHATALKSKETKEHRPVNSQVD